MMQQQLAEPDLQQQALAPGHAATAAEAVAGVAERPASQQQQVVAGMVVAQALSVPRVRQSQYVTNVGCQGTGEATAATLELHGMDDYISWYLFNGSR